MENQHQKIKGYRDLSQDEIDLMNRIKQAESNLLSLQREVVTMLKAQTIDTAAIERHAIAEPHRWAAEAKTDFQKGFMCLIRAVAQPTNQ